jgi:hypothetical protein
MIIIDKQKEYYDYIQSIYGIDKDIILDRRNVYETYYGKLIPDGYLISRYNRDYCNFYIVEVGTLQFILKASYKENENYNIVAPSDRYIIDTVELIRAFESDVQIIEKQKNTKSTDWFKNHYNRKPEDVTTNSPTNFYHMNSLYINHKYDTITFDDMVKGARRVNVNDEYVRLNEFSGFILSESAYNAIYDFLIKKREPVVVDNRTDVQKLEGKGFDKKTSFRKM